MTTNTAIKTIATLGVAAAISIPGLTVANAANSTAAPVSVRSATSHSTTTVKLLKRNRKLSLRVKTRGDKVITRWKIRHKKHTHRRALHVRHGVAKTNLSRKATRIKVRVKSHGHFVSGWVTPRVSRNTTITVITTNNPKTGNSSGSNDPGNSTSEFPWTNSDQIYIKTENSGMVWENKTSFSAARFSCSGGSDVPLGTVGTVEWGPKSWVGRKVMLVEVWEERSNTSYPASNGGFSYHSSWWQFLDENFKTPSIAEHPTWSGWVKPPTPDTIEGRKIMPLSYTGGTRF